MKKITEDIRAGVIIILLLVLKKNYRITLLVENTETTISLAVLHAKLLLSKI